MSRIASFRLSSPRGRAALLGSAATLAIALASPALAQDQTVVLTEGETVQGDVALDGADRLVLDISRINGDTGEINLGAMGDSPALLSGALSSAGGDDTVWLRATTSKTANIAWPQVGSGAVPLPASAGGVQFTGGTVYEASGNDTVLKLENRARAQSPTDNQSISLYNGPLRLAGDGVIDLTFSIAGDQAAGPDQAIVVEAGSTSPDGDGKLDLLIRGDINAWDGRLVNGELDPTIGAVDVRNASSVTFKAQSPGYGGSARMAISATTGVLGGQADIFIERGAYLAVRGDQAGLLIRSSGNVDNRGRLDGTGNDPSAGDKGIGVMLEGGKLLNTFTEGQTGEGIIHGGWAGVVAASGDNTIDNGALIQSRNKAAIESRGGSVVTRNRSHTLGNRTNAGRIIGGMVEGQQIAYQDVGSTRDLVVNSSIITGDVLMGDGTDTFLYTGATNGVEGIIDGGEGVNDAYGVSVSTSKTVTFDNALNNGTTIIGFEMHGVELNGANLEVTLEAAGNAPLDNGIKVLGAGTVTNRATIEAGGGYAIFLEHFKQLASGIDFVNEGAINAGNGVLSRSHLKSFRNTGSITGQNSAFAINNGATAGQPTTLDFLNEGQLIATGGGEFDGALIANMTTPDAAAPDYVLANFRNSGTIQATGGSADATIRGGGRAVTISTDGDALTKFNNTGTVEATGAGGVGLSVGGGKFDLINAHLVNASGPAGVGVLMRLDKGDAGQVDRLHNTASGRISANGGGFTGGLYGRAFAAGVGINGLTGGRIAQVDNDGTIEATGANSIAISVIGIGDVDQANFVLNNTGTIRGGDDTVVPEGEYVSDGTLKLYSAVGDDDEERVIAGGIQTWRTTDVIRNAATGKIIGSVDLGLGDDRLENYGSIDGNVRMGEGMDTFVLGGGSIAAGHTVSGGDDDDDLILADMSGAGDKVIDAAVFKQFERIERLAGQLGTGKLFIRGYFNDVDSLRLNGLAIHIAAGDSVETGSILTFVGGDESETIYNDGMIAEGVSLGGGQDHLFNTGSIASNTVFMGAGNDTVTNAAGGNLLNVDMGDGDDEVFNSGTITGDLDLGDGNDRYEAIGAGIVMGDLDGGLGNDTLVFRLNDQTTSIPNGFDGFESFAAYGPGTLQLNLNRPIDTLEILNGANLELTNAGAHGVGLIRGDNESQSVKIDAGFTGSVELLGGDDSLEMSLNGLLSGDLDGGLGNDTLTLNLTGASTINDLFNFENIAINGASPLTLEGELGAAQKITFDGGNSEFIIAENAIFKGQADGGAGSDMLHIITGAAGSRTIVAGQLTNFDQLVSEGAGVLEFDGGTYDFDSFEVTGGDVTIGTGTRFKAGSGDIRFTGDVDNRFTLEYGAIIDNLIDGGDGDGDVLAFSQGAGQIQKVDALSAENFEYLAASGEGELHIDRDVTFTGGVLLEGGNIKVLADVTLTADVIGGAGNDTFDNAGTVDGDILLGLGDDTYVARTGSGVTAGHTINGGAGGDDTVVFNLNDGVGSLLGDYVDFESVGVYGPGTLELDLTEDYNSITLWEEANLDLTSNGGTVGMIKGDNSAQTVTIDGALTGGVSLGGGNDTLNLGLGGVLSGDLDGGAGDNDVLNLQLTAESRVNGMKNFEVANVTSGGHALTLGGLGAGQRLNFLGTTDDELIIAAGAEFKGTVDGGAGQNLLRIQSGASDSRTVVASQILNFQNLISESAGTLALTGGAYDFDSVVIEGGDLELGANTTLTSEAGVVFDDADNTLTLASGATVVGGVDAGAGMDTLALIQAQGFSRNWFDLGFDGFERVEASGAGELRFDADTVLTGGLGLNGGNVVVMAGSTLTADVLGGAGDDSLAILGSLEGDLDLGGGADRLIVSDANGAGLRSGGAGDDTLDFRTTGSYAAPTVYDASRYQSFEKLAVSGGVVSLTSDSTWKGLSLTGGRLIGQAGTVLTSDTAIDVGAGAVFGSAGTVNADINVKGTLSPGASPGTMTVNGDVSFATGSNLLLEVSPTLSDLLNINGKMIIANGATIDITGVLASTPGAVLDLVVASEGIEGRFTTINKSNSIFGFVAQNGNKLQIRGEFQNDAAFGTNAQRSIAYANAVLASGQAVQTFTQAVPVLVDAQGVSNAAAFQQLTPEAYGSATLIGTETALTVVDATRTLDMTVPVEQGFYSFAQGMLVRSELEGRASTGAAKADLDLGGMFGGLGYATGTGLHLGGFIGHVATEQQLDDLNATTKSDSLLLGAFAGGRIADFNISGLVMHDQSDARTQRNLAVSPQFGRGRYDLSTWSADVNVTYPMSVAGIQVTPNVGLTYASTKRDEVTEAIGDGFALNVAADRKDGWFADAGVAMSTSTVLAGRTFAPYLQAGVRKTLSDDGQRVSGQLVGVDGPVLQVHGVRRDRTVARLAAGFSYELDSLVNLNAGYAGEFGDNARHTLTVGASLKF